MKKLNLNKLIKKVLQFRDERHWKKYHSPKNMIIAFYCELAELAEQFQYSTDKDLEKKRDLYDEKIADELIDVLWWTLLIAHEYKVDFNKFIKKEKTKKKNFKPRNSLLLMFESIVKISSEITDKKYTIKNKKNLSIELKGIFSQLILFSKFFNLDIEKEFFRKFKKNNEKYPIKTKRVSLLKLFSDKLHKTV